MVFLFELKTNIVEMIVINDFLANWNLMFSLKLWNKNWGEMRMVDNFLMIGQCVYYNISCWFFQVGHQNPSSRSWPHNWPWSCLLEVPQIIEELFFSLSLLSQTSFCLLEHPNPQNLRISLGTQTHGFLWAHPQMAGYNLEGTQCTSHNLQSGMVTNLWKGPYNTWCYLLLDLAKSKANGGSSSIAPLGSKTW
jgi:hypothetical protein